MPLDECGLAPLRPPVAVAAGTCTGLRSRLVWLGLGLVRPEAVAEAAGELKVLWLTDEPRICAMTVPGRCQPASPVAVTLAPVNCTVV